MSYPDHAIYVIFENHKLKIVYDKINEIFLSAHYSIYKKEFDEFSISSLKNVVQMLLSYVSNPYVLIPRAFLPYHVSDKEYFISSSESIISPMQDGQAISVTEKWLADIAALVTTYIRNYDREVKIVIKDKDKNTFLDEARYTLAEIGDTKSYYFEEVK